MEFRKFTLTKDDSDRRLDRVVRRFLPEVPLASVYKMMRKGLVRIDGKKTSPDARTSAGSELWIATCVSASAKPEVLIGKNAFLPEIILESPDLLFINKPCGIPVHGEGGLDRLIPQTAAAGQSLSFRTGPLHRLDRDTTGLLAFSRTLDGARWFSESVKQHSLEKYYLGIAEGNLSESAEWHDLSDDGKDMITRAVPLAFSSGKDNELTLVRYRIITGRKHQIRIQTSLHGHPLVGDVKYCKSSRSGKSTGCATYYLHAWQLVFPFSRPAGIPDRVMASLPDRFARMISCVFSFV